MKKKFKIEGEMWKWPGNGGWCFINIDKNISTKIRETYTKGFVKIIAKCGKSEWETSLFPYSNPVYYLLCINKKIREIEGLYPGDRVKIEIKIL